jgi:hypothetical protein
MRMIFTIWLGVSTVLPTLRATGAVVSEPGASVAAGTASGGLATIVSGSVVCVGTTAVGSFEVPARILHILFASFGPTSTSCSWLHHL